VPAEWEEDVAKPELRYYEDKRKDRVSNNAKKRQQLVTMLYIQLMLR